MKILIHGRSLAVGHERMRLAISGLERRGHEVRWHGGPVAEAEPGSGDRAPRKRYELVLGGGRAPAATAMTGWLAGAQGMLLSLGPAALGWNLIGRWCWESLDSLALVEPHDAAGTAERSHLAAERIVPWSGEPVPAAPDAGHPDTEILERACERTRVRRRGAGARPAAFLDRDGTLVVEKGYLARPEELEVLPRVPEALRQLVANGFALVVVSNQSGVDRGLFPIARVYETMAELRRALRRNGVELDGVYFCPHRPEAGCTCRKPGTALLERAARELGIALGRSAMFGDKRLDVAAGQRAGTLGVLVRTGYGRGEESRIADGDFSCTPDRVADDLADGVRWWLEHGDEAEAGA